MGHPWFIESEMPPSSAEASNKKAPDKNPGLLISI